MINMDKEFILSKPKGRANSSYIKKNYPNEYQQILEYPGKTFSEKLYNYFYNSPTHICPICGQLTPFRTITYGYSEFCSTKCSYQSKSRIEKIKKTCLERYGVSNPSQSKEIQKKKEETCMKNHGVKHGILTEQSKLSVINKYGVEHISYSTEIQEKKRKTWRENFLKKHDIHIGFTDNGDWICKCPYINCTQCQEKQFVISQQVYNDRKRNGTVVCTKLLPVGQTNQGTTIELFVRNILDKYKIEYEVNTRSIIPPKELDIYIPNKNIAIECNGCYWHSLKEPSYHINKFNECKKQNIQLINIWEDWFKTKPEVLESIIKTKLGIIENKIGARNCIIKEVDSINCKKFLNQNHIQGFSPSSIKLGLYYENELVSVMTFSKTRICIGKKEEGYELVRFCNKLNTIVNGGASKLLKYFIEHYKPTQIISYSSNDISNGDLYNILGFQKENESAIAYWYINHNTFQRYHRFNFRKQKLKEMGYNIENQTESQIMSTLPYWKIYDSGTTKWILKI